MPQQSIIYHGEAGGMPNEIRGPLPIKVDATSNGEFRPVPLPELDYLVLPYRF